MRPHDKASIIPARVSIRKLSRGGGNSGNLDFKGSKMVKDVTKDSQTPSGGLGYA